MKNKNGEVILDQEELKLLKSILISIPEFIKNIERRDEIQDRRLKLYSGMLDLLKEEIITDKEHMLKIIDRLESLEGKKKPVDDIMVR